MKTLLEHHYTLCIDALHDDPWINYAERIVACELLAVEKGWKHQCEMDLILLKVNQNKIYSA